MPVPRELEDIACYMHGLEGQGEVSFFSSYYQRIASVLNDVLRSSYMVEDRCLVLLREVMWWHARERLTNANMSGHEIQDCAVMWSSFVDSVYYSQNPKNILALAAMSREYAEAWVAARSTVV